GARRVGGLHDEGPDRARGDERPDRGALLPARRRRVTPVLEARDGARLLREARRRGAPPRRQRRVRRERRRGRDPWRLPPPTRPRSRRAHLLRLPRERRRARPLGGRDLRSRSARRAHPTGADLVGGARLVFMDESATHATMLFEKDHRFTFAVKGVIQSWASFRQSYGAASFRAHRGSWRWRVTSPPSPRGANCERRRARSREAASHLYRRIGPTPPTSVRKSRA